MEIQVLLNCLQVDDSERPHLGWIFDFVFFHHLAGSLNNPPYACLAHEHVVGFLGQHEAAGAGKGIKAGFRERAKLEFSITIGKEREHVKRQPVRRRLIERAQNARIVGIAGAARQQSFGFFAAIAPEVAMQQVDHSPQMAAFLHIHLKNVAQVIQRRTGKSQHLLLLHRSRLRIALRHDDAAQCRAVFARHFLPRRLALVRAKIHLPLLIARLQENSPAIFRHLDVIEMRPAVRLHADRCTQVHIVVAALGGPHVVPPAEKRGLPMLQRALQDAISSQIHVVWDFFRVIDHDCPSVLSEILRLDFFPVEFHRRARAIHL